MFLHRKLIPTFVSDINLIDETDMAATFNLELNSRPSKKGTYSIFLRITQNRKSKKIKTSIELKSRADFNPRSKNQKWIRTSETKHEKWNEVLIQEIEKAKSIYKNLNEAGTATNENVLNSIKMGEESFSFIDYAKQRRNDVLIEGGHRNYKKYNGFINKLEVYLKTINKTDILFSELTPSFLNKFKAHLFSIRNANNPEATLHPNTIAVNFNIFKAIINKSILEDKITPDKNPFLKFASIQEKATTKEKLNEAEIKLIEDLKLEEGSLIWHCRNSFLFSFYLAGIRAGDFIQLRWNNITNEGRLEYRMGKTDKARNILIHDKAMAILKFYYKEEAKPTDYIFPFLDSSAPYAKRSTTPEQRATLPPELIVKLDTVTNSKNVLINKYLNKIAQQAGIKKHISFHIARHSFAKIAKDNKVDNNHLKNLLGHSDIKITEAYMGNFDTEETDNVMAAIFKKKDEPKQQLDAIIKGLSNEDIEILLKQLERQ